MVDAVTRIDKAGRVVIPKEIREKMHLEENSLLLVAETDKHAVILKRLDVQQIAGQLRRELKGKDLDEIARKVEASSNERAKREGPKAVRG
jgi:AbrB family looped-hinge helix DNA binding protein